MLDDDIDRIDWEPTLRELLGDDAFLRLVENVGGLRFFVPMFPEQTADKFNLGMDILSKLSEAFRGEYIPVPLARNFRARVYQNRGCSQANIARRLGMTEKGVYRILRKQRELNGDDESVKVSSKID